MTLSIEVLPAPFGPMIARISCRRISRLIAVERRDAAKGEADPVGLQDRLADVLVQASHQARLPLANAARVRAGRQRHGRDLADRQLGAHHALAAVLEGDLGLDAARRLAGIERIDQRLDSARR